MTKKLKIKISIFVSKMKVLITNTFHKNFEIFLANSFEDMTILSPHDQYCLIDCTGVNAVQHESSIGQAILPGSETETIMICVNHLSKLY